MRRYEWDSTERKRNAQYDQILSAGGADPAVETYPDASACISQLRLLLHFLEPRNQNDAPRLAYFAKSFQRTVEQLPSIPAEKEWTTLLTRLSAATLRVLAASPPSSFFIDALLQLLIFLSNLIPRQMAHQAEQYYNVMATLTTRLSPSGMQSANPSRDVLVTGILSLLVPITPGTLEVYEWFARVYLMTPYLEDKLGGIDELAAGINYKLLASALDANVLPYENFLQSSDVNGRLWLLAYFIHFHRHVLGDRAATEAPETLFVRVVSALLSSASAEISGQVDTELSDQSKPARHASRLPSFVQNEILSLINQTSITHLLSHVGTGSVSSLRTTGPDRQAEDDAKSLATYALTLLRVFPRRADEIRMWLYLGSAAPSPDSAEQTLARLPAIKYFWNASRKTKVYRGVVRDPNGVLGMLRAPSGDRTSDSQDWRDREQEWTVILLFLELYTFLLKVLDDEEFFSGGYSLPMTADAKLSWTLESTLSLEDVKDLTVFLKNLAFTLYWNTADLTAPEMTHTLTSISDYFNPTASPRVPVTSSEPKKKDLVIGIPLDYFKALVTGLLRMVHERE